ncbi:MAG TPA: PKD domain-containing protein [Edaphocola sp.]|nr:PKD domain-containing protein [Edaphocola sp.]
MKRFLSHLNILALTLIMSIWFSSITKPLMAQQYAYQPASTSGNVFPFSSNTNNLRQSLYFPSDFGTLPPMGMITDVYFKASAAVTPNFTNLTIKMGHTSLTSMATGPLVGGLQTVYNGAYSQASVAGNYIKVTLQTPFLYLGQNLIVEASQTGYSPGFTWLLGTVTARSLYGLTGTGTGTVQDRLGDFGFDILPGGNGFNNAAMGNLVAPVNFCSGNHPIQVKLRNEGSNILNTLQVQWSLDGVMQTPYNITTPIDTPGSVAGNEQTVTLGNYTFATAAVNFKAWTTLPNGGADTINNNDTLVNVLKAALNGTYTINSGAPASNTNYQSFSSIANDLNDFGVCGPVTINVVSGSGPYNERVTFNDISGASSINTIRLNGNGETLQYNATATSDKQIFTLDGTKYFTLNNLKIKALNAGFGWGLHITGSAERDSIINCTIDLSDVTTNTSSVNANGIVVSGSATSATTGGTASHIYIGNNNVIAGSTLSGGAYYGIAVSGPSSTNQTDSISIVGNEISNFYYYGIRAAYIEGVNISGNDIHRSTKTVAPTTAYGIYNYYGIGGKVEGNKIHDMAAPGVTSTSTFYGMYNYPYNNTTATPMLVANNLIYNMGNYTGTQYLMYNNGPGLKIYHNTVDHSVVSTGSGTIYGMYNITQMIDGDIKNNLISITGGTTGTKYGIYQSTATVSGINYQKNNIYLNSTQTGTQNAYYYGSAYATLAAFQAAHPTMEIGSPNADPQFISPLVGNYTPLNTALIGSGFNVFLDVPTDINGLPRSTAPTIGAFEVAPSGPNDASMVMMVNPSGNICATTIPVQVIVSNAGTNSITSMKVNWKHNGVLQPQFSYTGNLSSPSSGTGQMMDTVTLGNVTLTSGLNNFEFWTSLPNGVVDVNTSNDSLIDDFSTTAFMVGTSLDTICPSGLTQLELTPSSGYLPNSISWQSSTDGGLTWNTISGANNSNYTVNGLNAATDFRAQIATLGTSVCNSSPITINILNIPTPTVTNASRCDSGTLTLGASATSSFINWYNAPTGGSPIFNGTSFTTPVLTSTTTYYVSAGNMTKDSVPSPNIGTSEFYTATAGWGLRFTANQLVSIDTVTVKARNTTAGAATMQVKITDLNDVVVYSGVVHNFNVTTVSTEYQIPVGVQVAPGDYKMVMTATGINNLVRESTGVSFPYTDASGLVSVTAGANGAGVAQTTSSYYWFYKWKISVGCESTRVPVTATIGAGLNVNLGNDTSVCQGTTVTLNPGTNTGPVTYLWNTGATTPTLNVSTGGTYSVVVDNGSCSKTDTIQVNIFAYPVVNLGNDTTICTGNSLTLNPGSNPSASYLWSNGATTPTININTAGTYSVTVTNGTICQAKDTIVVTTTPGPSVNLGADKTICQGTSTTLNAGTGTGVSYLWNTGATTQTISVNTSGTYYVLKSNGSCAASDTVVVNVIQKPILNLGNDVTVCAGTTVALNPGSNPNATYLWSTGATTPTISVNTAGTYVVTASSLPGCTSSDTIVVNVNQNPVVNIGNDTAVCMGTTVNLNAGASGSGMNYLWNTGATTPNIMVNTAGTYVVTVANNLTGCSTTDTMVLSYAPNPTAVLPDSVNICSGGQVQLNAGNNGSTYSWNTGATSQTINVNTAGQYIVNITNVLGCSINDTTQVTLQPSPLVDLGNDTAFCNQSSITLDAGNAGDNYLWNTGATSQSIVVNQTGVYHVTVTNQYGCTDSDSVEVSYLGTPSVDGFYATPRYDIQAGRIDFEGINPLYVTSYLWDFGDGHTSILPNPYHVYNAIGTYTVTLTVSNLCGTTQKNKTINVETATGVNNLDRNNAINIYPVPAQNILNVESLNKDVNIKTVKVLNVLGQELKVNQELNTNNAVIDISNIPSGNYLLKIETDKGMTTRRFNIVK